MDLVVEALGQGKGTRNLQADRLGLDQEGILCTLFWINPTINTNLIILNVRILMEVYWTFFLAYIIVFPYFLFSYFSRFLGAKTFLLTQ